MVYLTSNSSTLSCDNGDRPSVTVTVTNWDESRSGDKGILETPSLSDHQEQTIIEEQREDRSQSENGSRFNISVADCHHLRSCKCQAGRLMPPGSKVPRKIWTLQRGSNLFTFPLTNFLMLAHSFEPPVQKTWLTHRCLFI